MKVNESMRDYIVESSTRIICLGNNWTSKQLMDGAAVTLEHCRAVASSGRETQEKFIQKMLMTHEGRAALKIAISEVLEAYKSDRSVKFLTKKHVRNIIRLITICDEAEDTAAALATEYEINQDEILD